jgi:hypothetical protein
MDWKSKIGAQLWFLISEDKELMLLVLIDAIYGIYRNN